MPAEKFEKSLERLEALVKRLEGGELDLDGSLKAFEEGVKLSRVCEKHLNEAEKRVEALLKQNGHFTTEPYQGAQEDETASSRSSKDKE